MEFKANNISFHEPSFAKETSRFLTEEAGVFSGKDESAAGTADALAEAAVRISRDKNTGHIKEINGILKERKEAAREEKKMAWKMKGDLLPDAKPFSETGSRLTQEGIKAARAKEKDAVSGKNRTFSGKEGSGERPKAKASEHSSSRFIEKADLPSDISALDDQGLRKVRKKERVKAGKKNAAIAALRSKKELSNDLAGNKESTGNALKDADTGLIKVLHTVSSPFTYLKMLLSKLLLTIAPYALLAGVSLMVVAIGFSFIFGTFTDEGGDEAVEGSYAALSGIQTVNTGSLRNTALSESEIDEIVASSGADETEEKAIRFTLSKVGLPYSQALRTSGRAYDCSSMAYYTWLSAGFDISNGSGYPPTAAVAAKYLESIGKCVDTESPDFALRPGDLIFYGGKSNGRYMGIYHVAVYIGNGKEAEAYCTKYGCVYQDLKTKNACLIARL